MNRIYNNSATAIPTEEISKIKTNEQEQETSNVPEDSAHTIPNDKPWKYGY